MLTREEIRARWITRRDEYRRLNAQLDGGKVVDEFLADLETLQASEEGRVLTITDATLLSGYSVDHLRLLIRQGKIPNAGKRGAPRIRLGDLPRKPKRLLASTASTGYDVNADARALRSRRHTGDNNGGQY